MLLSRYKKLDPTFTHKITLKPALRINTLKITEKELISRLKKKEVSLKKIPYLTNGYHYEAEFSLGATPEYLQGYYYLQEAASQIPAEILNPKPKDLVLDMAAAPGSKTTQLAQSKANIIATDNNAHRLRSLRNNIERLGISSVIVYKKDARFIPDFNLTFDKILLDAPCSGNFCIEPNYFAKRTLADCKQRAKLQKQLLSAAYKVLKPNGTLVYSTCSLEPEENELVIDWFIKEHNITIEKININIGDPGLTTIFDQKLHPDIKHTKRLWPHKTNTQGFFIAKLKK